MSTEVAIEWKNPPQKSTTRNTKWAQIAEALRGNPGVWALVNTFKAEGSAMSRASSIRSGDKIFPKGEFEATSDGGDVYARYVGEPGEASPAPVEQVVEVEQEFDSTPIGSDDFFDIANVSEGA